MATYKKGSWDKFLTFLRKHEQGDSQAFAKTREYAINVMAYRPPPKRMSALSPGNMSVPAKWLAMHSPADVVPALRQMIAEDSYLAAMAVRDVLTILGSQALPVLEEMHGKPTDYWCLISAVRGTIDTLAKSAELEQAADKILARLVRNIQPDVAPTIIRLIPHRPLEANHGALEAWLAGEDPQLAFYAAALLNGANRGGQEGALQALAAFNYGLPVAAFEAMSWKKEWEPLRQLIESQAVPCLRIRTHESLERGASGESFFGGIPGWAAESSWPPGRSGAPMTFFARMGGDLLRAGGYSRAGAIDLWADTEGQWEENLLLASLGLAAATPANSSAEEGSAASAPHLKRAWISFTACLDLPSRAQDPDAPAALKGQFELFSRMAHGFEGNDMHQAFGSQSEDYGFPLLVIRDDRKLNLCFNDSGEIGFWTERPAKNAAGFGELRSFVNFA